ncbi:helix-turn-helix domain-containing protein [Uniformispora flossi]|uniref:helix-turn-helix domain-containing protein n=1 Tax=Uniformispora flossi TaxID=3390723 RepID=UPI003C2B7104
MPAGGKPTVRSRRLGGELRRLREATGMSSLEVADVLGCSQAKISRMENGIVTTRVGDLLLLLDTYSVSDPQHRKYLERLARESNKQGWWESYSDTIAPHYAEVIGLENDATYIRTWQSAVVPGLLQLPDYTRALMLANPAMISPDKIESMIQIREARQRRLHDAEHLRYHAIVWAPVLLSCVGSPEVHARQLESVLETAGLPTVNLQVLPMNPAEFACLSTPFTMFSFGSDAVTSTVFLENATSSHYLESADAVMGYTLIFDTLRSAALSTTQSIRFIEKLVAGVRK